MKTFLIDHRTGGVTAMLETVELTDAPSAKRYAYAALMGNAEMSRVDVYECDERGKPRLLAGITRYGFEPVTDS